MPGRSSWGSAEVGLLPFHHPGLSVWTPQSPGEALRSTASGPGFPPPFQQGLPALGLLNPCERPLQGCSHLLVSARVPGAEGAWGDGHQEAAAGRCGQEGAADEDKKEEECFRRKEQEEGGCVPAKSKVLSDSWTQHGSSVHGILQARILEWVPCPPPGDLLVERISPKVTSQGQ